MEEKKTVSPPLTPLHLTQILSIVNNAEVSTWHVDDFSDCAPGAAATLSCRTTHVTLCPWTVPYQISHSRYDKAIIN